MKEPQYLDYIAYVEKYREIIDDYDKSLEFSQKPLPKIIWTNLSKTTPDRIENLLQNNGVKYKPLSWWPGAFRILSEYKPGKTIEFLSGQIHVQEEVSMLPVVALAPQPSEDILDMCAAPGNKTAGLCMKMKEQGLVIANDQKSGRIALLQNNLSRLGFTNVVITQSDGTQIRDDFLFDKILVDAPCSAEGNIRKSKWSRRNDSHSLKFQPIQMKLLRRALKLVKPGGVVVYSTCTYSPDENEIVVNSVLSDQLVLEDNFLPKEFTHSTGIKSWRGENFDTSITKTCRIWPHQNDTGGFYLAKLRKL